MPDTLDNPETVAWSHSDRQADFYELPTEGADMREALAWLLGRYASVKLWMGVDSSNGTELFFACSPSQPEIVVARLKVYESPEAILEGLTEEA